MLLQRGKLFQVIFSAIFAASFDLQPAQARLRFGCRFRRGVQTAQAA